MVPLMSESMDRPLGLREQLQLRLHLMVCAWCARYLQQIRFLRQLLRNQVPAVNSRPLLNAEARARISERIRKLI